MLNQSVEQMTSQSIFLDWKLWSTVISCLALILSQLPPIRVWFKKAKIELDVYSRIFITHKIGNPQIQLHLIIRNSGGRNVRCTAATIGIFRDGVNISTISAQNYLQNTNDKETILFTPFKIEPEGEWAHIVNFLNFYSRDEEKEYRQNESNLRLHISGKRDSAKDEKELVEAEPQFYQWFIKKFESVSIWKHGEYRIDIKIHTDSAAINLVKSYKFIIYESDSMGLGRIVEYYKFGDGIFWESGHFPGPILPISDIKITSP